MGTALKGTVHGRTIELDQQVERLDGQRVLVVLDPIEEPAIAEAEAADAWRAWTERGPDGPIRRRSEAYGGRSAWDLRLADLMHGPGERG